MKPAIDTAVAWPNGGRWLWLDKCVLGGTCSWRNEPGVGHGVTRPSAAGEKSWRAKRCSANPGRERALICVLHGTGAFWVEAKPKGFQSHWRWNNDDDRLTVTLNYTHCRGRQAASLRCTTVLLLLNRMYFFSYDYTYFLSLCIFILYFYIS